MLPKKMLVLLTFVAAWALMTPHVSRAAAVPEGVTDAARAGLPKFLRAVPADELRYYGFDDPQGIYRAALGEPFRVHTLWPQEILAFADGEPADVPVHETSMWLFPVLCDGTPRTLLTVDLMHGAWEAVNLGGFSPGPEMLEAADRWPEPDGYGLKYVTVLQTGSQFISVTQDGLSRLVPLEGTARSLGIVKEDEVFEFRRMDVAEIADILAPFVRASLERMDE